MTWARAYHIAAIAMGREYVRGGKNGYWHWRAHDDPLAAHCLAELIMEVTHG
jgi:hypothetical protein